MSNFDSTKKRLSQLLQEIVEGKIQLPDFQRGWVWGDQNIRSLLVSIARSFPIGAIMMLEAGGDTRFKVRPVEGLDSNKIIPDVVEQLLLDGQQRLTSLTQVLMLDKPVETHTATNKAIHRYYYIDIKLALEGPDYYEDAFIAVDSDRTLKENFGRDIKLDLRTPKDEYDSFYFPCNQILNSDEWEEGLNNHDPAKFPEYMRFRKQVLLPFRNYDIPIIQLSKDNKKEAVCLVFEKVNTGGVALSVFELITASYAADGINLRDEWYGNPKNNVEGIHQKFAKYEFIKKIESTDFFQGLSLLYTWEKRQADLNSGKTGKQVTGVSAKRETVLSLPLAAYQQWKPKLIDGFCKAAQFLRQESFLSTQDLPYRTQLVPLAAVLALLDNNWRQPRIYDKLARWFWCGVIGELYGGAVETRMASDIQDLMAWIHGSDREPTTVQDANFQPNRLETLRSRNSAAYKGISVLIQREGSKDFFWKCTISDLNDPSWKDQKLDIDIHHIFPKRWCEEYKIPAGRYNSILNKTPISYKANRMIGGKAPSQYLKQLQSHQNAQLTDAEMDAILKTHCIDPNFLRQDDFEGFITARKQALLSKIEAAIGKSIILTDDTVPEDAIDEDEEI